MDKLRMRGLSALQPEFIEVWEAIACDISPAFDRQDNAQHTPNLSRRRRIRARRGGMQRATDVPPRLEGWSQQEDAYGEITGIPSTRATSRSEYCQRACGSILLADPLFSENVVASGLV